MKKRTLYWLQSLLLCWVVAFCSVQNVYSADRTNYYQPDYNKYSETMTMVCIVVKNGQQVTDCELAAFVGDEVRASSISLPAQGGRIFLSVQGQAPGEALTFKVVTGTASAPVIKEGFPPQSVTFLSNARLGSYDNPIVINLTSYDLDHNGEVTMRDVAEMIQLIKSGDTTYVLSDVQAAIDIILMREK